MWYYLLECGVVSLALGVVWSGSTMLSLFSLLALYLLMGVWCFSVGLGYVGSVILVMYVSAVGMLFLFVLMLMDNKGVVTLGGTSVSYVVLVLVGSLLWWGVGSDWGMSDGIEVGNVEWVEDLNELEGLGSVLYGKYLWEVLVVGILCLTVVLSVLYL